MLPHPVPTAPHTPRTAPSTAPAPIASLITAAVTAAVTTVLTTVVVLAATLSPAGAARSVTYESQVLSAANHERADHGLRPLRRSRCLARLADAHARRMAARRTAFHQDMAIVVRRCGLRRASENVAVGYGSGRSAVETGWMPSPAHRANILGRGDRLTAAAAVRDELGTWWTVQLFARR